LNEIKLHHIRFESGTNMQVSI